MKIMGHWSRWLELIKPIRLGRISILLRPIIISGVLVIISIISCSRDWSNPLSPDGNEKEPPIKGLVAYFPFNGNANDESGNGNNGTVNGATLTTDRFGTANNAYLFDGVDDYLDMGDVLNNLQLPFSVSTWLYWKGSTSPDEDGIICSDNNLGHYYEGFRISIHEGGVIGFRIGDSGIAASFNRSDAGSPINSISLNRWTHLFIEVKALTDVDMYFDGESVQITYTGTGGNMVHTGNPLVIGRYTYDLSQGMDWFYKGIIDDVKIYNRALTEEEIQALYHERGWDN